MTAPAVGRLVVVAPPAPGAAPSARATDVLATAGEVWAEAGRRADGLLDGADVPAATRHRVAAGSRAEIVTAVAGGAVVALVTAGTPGVSRPVADAVAAVVADGLPVEVVPAADAAVTALVASGLATDHVAVDPPLPDGTDGAGGAAARKERLRLLAGDQRTTALPTTADRVAADLAAVAAACGGDRSVAVTGAVGPEQAVWRGTAEEAARWVAGTALAPPGDLVVVVGGAPDLAADAAAAATDEDVLAALQAARARGLAPGRAAAEVAAATGRSRRQVYALGTEDTEVPEVREDLDVEPGWDPAAPATRSQPGSPADGPDGGGA